MVSHTASAVHLILADQLLPAIRTAVVELGGDSPSTLVHDTPTPAGSTRPTNSVAVLVHHLRGVLKSWGAACLGGEAVERDRESEFFFRGLVEPELIALESSVARLPEWARAAEERGGPGEPTGTAFPVDDARADGSLTTEWVLAHILHDVAAHLGHIEITRDVLLTSL